MSGQKHIPGGRHGFFDNEYSALQQLQAINNDYREASRVDQPPFRIPRPSTGLTQEKPTQRTQQALNQALGSQTEVSSVQRSELHRLESQAVKAREAAKEAKEAASLAHQDLEGARVRISQRSLNQEEDQLEIDELDCHAHSLRLAANRAERAAKQAQQQLENVRQRHSQRRYPLEEPSTSSPSEVQQPRPRTYGLVNQPGASIENRVSGFDTNPTNGKRNTNQRDDGQHDIDSDENGRRVRRRIDTDRPQFPHQPMVVTTTSSRGKSGVVTQRHQRHQHPYARMKPPQPSSGVASQRAPSYAQYPARHSDSFIPPQPITRANEVGTLYDQSQSHSNGALHAAGPLLPSQESDSYLGIHPSAGKSIPAQQQVWQPPTNFHQTTPATGKRRRSESIALQDGSATPEESNGAQLTVKRQIKRQKLLASGKKIPKDSEKVQGDIRFDNDGHIWANINGTWMPAAYHHERRHSLLRRAAQKGAYTYPPAQGVHPDDKTAFHEAYAEYDMSERTRRPNILYQWNPPKEQPPLNHPGYMRDPSDGVYLLDRNDHPILDWPELPLTISGQVEGLFLELWYRLNRHITTENMLARCPALTQKAGPKSHRDDPKTQIRPLPGISAYGNRRERHRLLIGTCAWDKKEGSASIQAQLKRVLPNSVLAELEQQGTTRTWRDLSNQEVNAICYVNKGQGTASLRAGNRRLTDEKKKEVDAKKDPVLEDTFEKLLQEKRDLDALDQETAHTRATNAGSSNVDPAAGVIHEGPEILTENDTHINLQYSENEPGQRDGATMFEQFVNEFDDTLVQDPWPQQTLATPKESGQRLDDTQGSVHQTGNKELEQPIDFRYEYPRTREQEYSITMALVMTRQMFRSVTGEEPPVAPKGENYMGQWLQLQYHFKEFYLKNYPGSPIPWLPQQPKWHDDWNGWELQDQNFVASGNEQDGLDLETHVAQTSSAAQKGQASNPYNLNPVRAYNEAFDASAMALQTPAPGPMAAPGSVEVTAVNNDTKAAESSEENGHGNSLSGPAQSSGVENSSKSPSIPGTADPWAELDTLIEEANAMAPKLGAKQAAIGGQLPSAFQEAPWNDFDELIRNPNFLAAPYRDTSGTDNLDPALTIMLGNPHDAVLPAASNDIHNSYPASTNTLGNPRDAVLPAASNDIEDTTTALPLPKATSPQAKFVSLSQLLKDDSQPVQYHDQPAPDKEDDGEHSDANSLFGGGLG